MERLAAHCSTSLLANDHGIRTSEEDHTFLVSSELKLLLANLGKYFTCNPEGRKTERGKRGPVHISLL
jgi:hypothetical protein